MEDEEGEEDERSGREDDEDDEPWTKGTARGVSCEGGGDADAAEALLPEDGCVGAGRLGRRLASPAERAMRGAAAPPPRYRSSKISGRASSAAGLGARRIERGAGDSAHGAVCL